MIEKKKRGRKNGHLHTAEARAKMSASASKRMADSEARKRISFALKGEKNPMWRGGRMKTISGGGQSYIKIYCPTHPHRDFNGYVMEHRLVMERHLGRMLLPNEVVHHINGDSEDNRIENLALFSSGTEHLNYHRAIKAK